MAAISLISIIQKIFKLPTPSKFGSLAFQVLMETEYQHWPLWKNWKMAVISLISIVWKNFKLPTSPKVWVSSFPSVNRNRISTLAIMKKLKKGCHFFNINHTVKFQITNSLKVWVSGFPSVNRNRISALAIVKKLKMATISLISIIQKNFKLLTPKVWVSGFPSVDGNGISASVIMKKLKNGCHFFDIDRKEKFQITKLPNLIFFEFSIGLFFLITHPRFHFNIYAWLHLKHLCMDIYASLVYHSSHLCVVLHFLIFV